MLPIATHNICFDLTFFILMDYLIHIDTVIMEFSVLYFKGLRVKISKKNDVQ